MRKAESQALCKVMSFNLPVASHRRLENPTSEDGGHRLSDLLMSPSQSVGKHGFEIRPVCLPGNPNGEPSQQGTLWLGYVLHLGGPLC